MTTKAQVKATREERLVTVASMYLKGHLQREIGEVFGLTQQAIARDIKELQKRWRESALVDFNEALQRELARIDELEREYWQAWRDSKKSLKLVRQIDEVTEKGSRTGTHKEARDSHGDSAYLAGVERCIAQRCKILGLNAPDKITVSWRDEAKKDGHDPETIFREMVAAARLKLAGDGGGGSVGGSEAPVGDGEDLGTDDEMEPAAGAANGGLQQPGG